MTVSTTIPTISYNYTGPGDYTFPYRILADTDLIVTHIDAEGYSTVLAYGGATGYTVTTVDGVDGGTCHLVYAATSGTLSIDRNTKISQEVDWQDSGPLSEELLETSFDRDIMILQEFYQRVSLYGSWRGMWETNTSYVVNDIINLGAGSSVYIAVIAHTSGTWVTDLAAGYWEVLIDTSSYVAPAEVTSNPNLLVNSDFSVNQRAYAANGVVSLADGAYGHDMFMAYGGSLIYKQETDGDITLTSFTEVAAGTVQLWQKNDEVIDTSGETVTVSLYVESLTLPVWIFVEGSAVQEITTTGWQSYTFVSSGAGDVGLGHTFTGAGTYSPGVTFNSWKVERGATRTVWSKPEPRTEDNRSKYYYRSFGAFPSTTGSYMFAKYVSGVQKDIEVSIPGGMRTIAGVTTSQLWVQGFTSVAGEVTTNLIAATPQSQSGDGVVIRVAHATGLSETALAFIASVGYVKLDANYYS